MKISSFSEKSGAFLVTLALVLSSISSILVPSVYAQGGPPVRKFSASAAPASVVSPSVQQFTVTFTNDPTSTDNIKSARLTLPSGFTLENSPTPSLNGVTNWEICQVGQELQFGRNNGGTEVLPGSSFSVTFTATISASAGSIAFPAQAFKNDSCSPGNGAEFDSNLTPITIDVTPPPTPTYEIDASADSGGSISPDGTVTVNENASQGFTITPDSGFHILDVLVDLVSQGPISVYTFLNVTADHTIHATFEVNPPNTHTITATAGSGGTITPSGSVLVTEGQNQGFSIVPDSGYEIDILTVDGSPIATSTSYTFTNVTADHTIEVTFLVIPVENTVLLCTDRQDNDGDQLVDIDDPDCAGFYHTITASAGVGGSVDPDGSVSVVEGDDQDFEVDVDSGYQVDELLVDGVPSAFTDPNDTIYTFSDVDADHIISVTFSLIPPTPTEDTLALCSDSNDNDNDNDVDLEDDDCAAFIPTLTVVKVVVNDNAGVKTAGDFVLFIDQNQVSSGIANEVDPGTYVVSETPDADYTGSIDGDCDAQGSVSLAIGEHKTCTITNDDVAPAATDVCSNIAGVQTQKPDGMQITDEGECIDQGRSGGRRDGGGGEVLGAILTGRKGTSPRPSRSRSYPL